ncbi:nucleolar protein dao-5-like [Hemibagrus wyckioides]|uniref:nucleolar protein dao-5-like n=1 Tax=Hemibagrus wyckioides TaxID=337641 RepID=UPI00266D39B8|nr:nucleolar protein dao-5-like [Hemibagrus wyckioides]
MPELLDNQPYDETLDISNSEELASLDTRTPRQAVLRNTSLQQLNYMASSGNDESEDSIKQKKTGPPARPCEPAETDDEDYDEEDDDEEDSDDTESDEDDGEPRPAPEGAYDPSDYDHLHVSSDIKDIFQFITRYTPQNIELDHKLKPFIPDFIPAVGDIDAFLKVPRPDGKVDGLGLVVLDEPCAKQSDPVVLSMGLSENSKQHNVAEVKVKSIESAQKNPKAIDDWIDSVSELHRSKPPATVLYTRPMPDTDTLMQEWPPEFEELFGKLNLPTADIDCDLEEYIDTICGILDIPVYESRIQSLHVLFSLYSEIRNFQPELIAKPPNNKTLDINDSGEVASLYAPTPWQAVLRNTSQQQLKSMANSSSDESEDSTKQKKTGPPARPCEPAETDEEDDDDEDDSDDTESDEDYGAPRPAPERYTPQTTVMDKPCAKQSDPTVLSPWLSENRKQHNVTEVKVKSIKSAQKNPKAIDDWIDSVSQLHRSKPPATVLYTRPMPDTDTLMQEWPPEFEELLGKLNLPTADIDCDLEEYIDTICGILDIPVYESRIQSLHVLFSLYSEIRNFQPELIAKPPNNKTLDINDSGEVASLYAPTPWQAVLRNTSQQQLKSMANSSSDESEDSTKQKKTGPPARPCEPAETDEEDDDDEDDSDDTESDEDYGAPRPAPERYTTQTTVMDKPCAKQSDPTVLSPWLSENRKQHNVAEVKVKSIKSAQKNPKAIDDWIDSISQLHRSKPPATVLYTRPMPDIDTLMQEWPPEFEELLGKQKKTGPPARPCEPAETDEDDDDDEEEDSDETESDEDDGEPRTAPERYTTQTTVMDKPCAKQSDPTVLSPWLSENRKQHNVAEVKVKSIKSAQKNPKAIDDWIDSISRLHRSKPPATVLYTRPMPDIDNLMQEWPPDFEERLGKH